MKRNLFAIAALFACSLATAAPQDFKVEYKGFFNTEENRFDPAARLELWFSAEDTNGDGSYSIDELSMFAMDRIYTQGGPCDLFSCVYDFNYTPGALPTYTASYYMSDDRFAQSTMVKGGEYFQIWDRYISSDPYIYSLQWTGATQTWINGVLVPVPEPATYAMFGLGLGALLVAGRRRGKA